MGKNNHSESFEIALSAISCAAAVAFLLMGILSGILLATGYFIGIIAMMLPLSKQFFKGGFLAYAATCILTLILGAAAKGWDLVPFIMFFGLHPLLNALQIRFNINRWLAYAVKAVWFDATLAVGYLIVFGGVLGGNLLPSGIYDFINNYIYILIFTVGTVAFLIYDILIFKCQILVNCIVYRIKK